MGRFVRKQVNPTFIGDEFLNYCVKQGWIKKEKYKFYVTGAGAKKLEEKFGITIK
jgi:hypothetical protein